MRPEIEKPETQNQRLNTKGLAKPNVTRLLMGAGPGFDRQEAAGRVFGWFWNQPNHFSSPNTDHWWVTNTCC